MIRRKQIITLLLTFVLATQLVGASVTGVRIVNNTSEHSDYKLNESECSTTLNDIKDTSEVTEEFTKASTRVKTNNEVVDALLEDNLINRDYELSVSSKSVNISQNELVLGDRINRTNTLMYLSRVKDGNITSRPFVVRTKSERDINGKIKTLGKDSKVSPNNYEGSDTRFDYSKGDYNVYVNNAIPELYLTRLLQQGVIKEDDIADKDFITQYNAEVSNDVSVVPEWSNQLQPYIYNDAKDLPTNQLGKTWKFHNYFKLFTAKPTSFKVTKEYKGNFFVNEKISKLEVLDLIYEMYKDTLQPFNDSLQELLLFKYGSSDISALPQDEQNKILILIYNGIINRDNTTEVTNLNSDVTGDFLFPIIYRLKHSEERVQIDLAQLSAGDIELAKDGFVRNDVGVYDGTKGIEPQTVSVTRVESSQPLATVSDTQYPTYGDPDEDDTNVRDTSDNSNSFMSRTWNKIQNAFDSIKDSISSLLGQDKDKETSADVNTDTDTKDKDKDKDTDKDKDKDKDTDTDTKDKDKDDSINKDTSVSTENTDGNKTKDNQTSTQQDRTNADDLTSAIGATQDGKAVDYEIVKIFPNPDKVLYKGVKVSEVTTSSPKDSYIKSVEDAKGGGKKITFKINASSDVEALAVIDSNTTFDVDAQEVKHLQTVTKVTGDKRGAVYISAKEIENSLGELVVVSNKVLKNKKTGAVAVLLTDHHKAMVGNRIIITDEPIAITNTADTYYNMEFIAPLMSNAYISSIDPEKLFLDNTLPVEDIVQVSAKGGGGGLDANLEKSMVLNSSAWNSGLFTVDESYFNLDMVTRGISCLTRELNINGKKAYVIVDWSYSLPDNDETILNYFKQKDLSVKEASDFLFTRPKEGTAQQWWDSNIDLSNALANMMYNTKKVDYITSGYLKPDVTVLLPENGASKEDVQTYLTNKIKLSADYLTKYCESSIKEFDTKLFNGGKGDVTGRRKFRVIEGKQSKNTKDGQKPDINNFDDDYVVTATGAIYRNIRKDNRMKYDSEKKELQVSGRQLNDDSNELKSTIKIGDRNYYVQKSGQYLMLTDVSGDTYSYSNDKGSVTFNDEDTNKIKTKIKETMKNIIDSNPSVSESDFKPIDDYSTKDFSVEIDKGYYKGKKAYFANGNLIIGDKVDSSNLQSDSFVENQVGLSTITVFPTVYLPGMSFSIENNQLVKKMSVPYLEQGNVLFSGLNSTIMSRLIDDNADVVKYSELADGVNVIIGDTTYKKNATGLNSEPIVDSTLATGLASNSMDGDKIKSLILGRFTGLQLLFSGRPVSFTSYITKCGIGTLEYSDTHNTYYYKNNVAYFSQQKGQEELYSNQALDSVCINLKLDDDVQFYLLDSTTNTYAIKYASDKYCDGYIDQIAAFSEDLGFGISQDAFLELRDNIYVPAENYTELFKQSQLAYHTMMKGDIISILQYVLTAVISYIILASWIGTVILKGRLGLSLLLAIRNPSGVKGAEGFDFIKFMTFGLWNLDSEPKISSIVVANVLLFGLLYIVIDCGTIIKYMFY